MGIDTLLNVSYLAAAALFIFGLKRMSSPASARTGIVWAGWGMVIATVATFAVYFHRGADGSIHIETTNLMLCVLAIGIGTAVAWTSGKRVAMTDMPQMVALYNGMGGGSAAAIGAVELWGAAAVASAAGTAELMAIAAQNFGTTKAVCAVVGALIGAISFSGSFIAFAKLQGWMDKRYVFPGQQMFNIVLFVAAIVLGGMLIFQLDERVIIAFFAVCLILGVSMTLPIGGADMPVVISLYNAFTGLAVALEGYVMQNPALIIAGTVVGAAGTLLTQLMAKAMNRPISNVLFSNFGAGGGPAQEISGAQKPVEASDACLLYTSPSPRD